MNEVTVLGAGLAGSECAWQLAKRGIKVRLYEMKPAKMTPAHTSEYFAELVCSNSLRSDELTNAVGLLKAEMRKMGSLIMESADTNKVAAGGALAVDREGFARYITEKLRACDNIEIVPEEAAEFPEGECIVATGPLTSDALADKIASLCGGEGLHFYDAVAPIVTLESVDMESAFFASRYDKGTADYVNCPMDEAEYKAFVRELCAAKEASVHGFDDGGVFEGCMPIEIMAARGVDTIRFGPMKPVGLTDPRTGKRPFAVLQLRKENAEGSLLNLVGFQTHLTFGEQKRVFSLIPALKNAEFVRYGVMHKNIFINSPALLDCDFSMKSKPEIFFAGQISGVEGYVESIAGGLMCGVNAFRRLKGKAPIKPDGATLCGALALYVSSPNECFQPMNANFGILKPLGEEIRDKAKKKEAYALRALAHTDKILTEVSDG